MCALGSKGLEGMTLQQEDKKPCGTRIFNGMKDKKVVAAAENG